MEFKRVLCFVLSVFAIVVIFANPVSASPQHDILAPDSWYLSTPTPADSKLETVSEADAPGGEKDIARLTVTTPSDPLWRIQFQRNIGPDVPAGDLLRLHFWARSPTLNPVRVSFEQTAAPWQGLGDEMITLTPDWTEYTLDAYAISFGANGISVHFQCGSQAGVIELSGATVVDIGEDPAIIEAKAALAPDQIQSRIEKYRKGDLAVKVVGLSGRPVPATVTITQTRHAFLFGCNIFNLNPTDTSPVQLAYQQEFAALFNYATLPFYWGAFEYQQGKPDYARLQTMADWCVSHNITPKGHPLIWQQVWPSWAPRGADSAIPLLKARVDDLIPRYKDTIRYWDVVNEANYAAEYDPANGESMWVRRDGPLSVVGTALDWARNAGKGLPDTFIYNDYNVDNPNVTLLTGLQKEGKLPDAIGLQSHMHSGTWPLTKVWAVCQKFSKFGKPIHFTETTVISGPKRDADGGAPPATDWSTTSDGEAAQAKYVAEFYTVLFSHPSVRAITWWDFSDLNSWMGAPSGLVRKDMSPKPAYTALMDLIHRQWWTTITAKTTSSGTIQRRVFYGDYTITVTNSKGTTKTVKVTFPESAPPMFVKVQTP